MNKKIKIALVSNDVVGKTMAGPGIRYSKMAEALAKHFDVTLFAPDCCDLDDQLFKIKLYNSKKSSASIANLLGQPDYVVAQNLYPNLLKEIKRKKIRFIADLYDPLTIEVMEYTAFDTPKARENVFDFNYQALNLQLDNADHFLCASEKQKDFYLGMLSGRKIVNPRAYAESPDFSKFISLFPIGLADTEPVAKNKNFLEEKFSEIKTTDKIVYWGGGVWNWFDSMSVVKAIEIISQKRSDVKLFFLGIRHPNPKVKEMEMAQKTLDYCKEKNLLNKFVFFNFDWTPYEEMIDCVTRANVGISAHFNNLETRFSFRTRILDYLWADLPMVLTAGDAFADLAEKHDLGLVVDYENPEMIADSILSLLDNPAKAKQIQENIHNFKKNYTWDSLAKNLVDLIKRDQINFRPNRGLTHAINTFNFYRAGLKKKLGKK